MRLSHFIRPLSSVLVIALLAAISFATSASAAHGDQHRIGAPKRLAGPSHIGIDNQIEVEGTPVCAKGSRLDADARRLHRRKLRARRAPARASVARRCLVKEPETATTVAPPSSIYWGAWIGNQLTGEESPWDMSAVSDFEQMADKQLSIVNFGSPFANCASNPCSFYSFPTEPMQHIREHGSIPFLSWSSQSIPSQVEEPEYQLSAVAAGRYDSYIRTFAEAAREWGHPFFLRFDWEMNGNWFPWGAQANGNSPAEYVAAWRHVHDIFTEVGATNATWVWCPNVDPAGSATELEELYPGNEYVDWTGLDGYNWGTNPSSPKGWKSFDELYRSTYERIVNEVSPGKPMIVSEMGSSEDGGSKAAWISEALGKITTEYPDIRGVLWFEKYDDGMDWPIETSPTATAAFASGIQAPAFATNSFSELGSGPIQPPSA
jgi:mannan endo-1,4-beta-mannosidase